MPKSSSEPSGFRYIELFPKFRDQETAKRRYLSPHNDSQLVALLEVVQLIPSELINLNPDDYIELISSIAAIRHMIETWKTNPPSTL